MKSCAELMEAFDGKSLFLPVFAADEPTYNLEESVSERNIFYRLSDSEIFSYANKNTDINGMKLLDIIPRMAVDNQGFHYLSLSELDKVTVYELFESNRFKMQAKSAIRKLIESGAVQMVYSKEYRLPTSLPYIAQLNGRTMVKILLNVSEFLDVNEYGQYSITMNRNYNAMMAAMTAACLAYRILTTVKSLPSAFADGFVLSYASMMEKCINALIHMDPITREKITYLSCKFGLVQMYGTERGLTVFERFRSSYFPKLSPMITNTLDDTFPEDSFDNLTAFILQLSTQYHSMRGLTLYKIYEKWVHSFGPATALAIDYLGYHLYTISMVLLESPFISRNVLEPILEKSHGTSIYKSMQMILGGK